MKQIAEVTPDKLRGGFYTSEPVVDFCVRRILSLTRAEGPPQRWLEPSAGDGAFLLGLARAKNRGDVLSPRVTAVELNQAEARKCAAVARGAGLRAEVVHDSFFSWAAASEAEFDALFGNPPFVRYQFVAETDRELFEEQSRRLGIELRGVSNLWIPFAVLSLARLRAGGAFALVLPGEIVSTVSAERFRSFFVRHFVSIQVDLFPRDTFAELLQDVVVLSGRRSRRPAPSRTVTFCEHQPGHEKRWSHQLSDSGESWVRYFLTDPERAAFESARELPGVHRLGSVARLEVSIVTGANAFFTVDDATRQRFSLAKWSRPLLARTADCPGLVFKSTDHEAARRMGSRGWLLDFGPDRPAPIDGAASYLELGSAQGLPGRFKCRIRDPWYRVPQIKSGMLMLAKRAHLHHRLLLNEACILTTDTVYRGDMKPDFAGQARDLVAAFQNTLTLLSTEIEGRSYGGGVLELVPSEIARLSVPVVSLGRILPALDRISREARGQRDTSESLRRRVDAELARRIQGYGDLLPALEGARRRLVARRLRT